MMCHLQLVILQYNINRVIKRLFNMLVYDLFAFHCNVHKQFMEMTNQDGYNKLVSCRYHFAHHTRMYCFRLYIQTLPGLFIFSTKLQSDTKIFLFSNLDILFEDWVASYLIRLFLSKTFQI